MFKSIVFDPRLIQAYKRLIKLIKTIKIPSDIVPAFTVRAYRYVRSAATLA